MIATQILLFMIIANVWRTVIFIENIGTDFKVWKRIKLSYLRELPTQSAYRHISNDAQLARSERTKPP